MSKRIKSIVIVGGGTAGWITAGVIAAHNRTDSQDGVSVTLIESPNVPIIGVGEGTWPTMRATLQEMGASETEFFRECDASFKQGADFRQWVTGAPDDHYYHPLVLPQGFLDINLAPHWLADHRGQSFAGAVCAQEHLCERNLAPKQITTPEFAGVENYAYHLNAGKFSQFLHKHCVEKLGVRHILDDVVAVNAADNGDIESLSTQENGLLHGDLFIDCTGFRSLLLGQHYGVPFKDCGDILFIDRALAIQAPYDHEDAPIASQTNSTAQEAGWIWDIALSSRRGVGHVFSTKYMDEDRAESLLRDYLRPTVKGADELPVRRIDIRSGHREKFWVNNCVAIGLSAGFLEPLEASALVLVELSAGMVAKQLPVTRSAMDVVARRFNDKFLYRWDRIIDFLKLHYILSKRTDNAFWIDNRDPKTIPDSLQELLTLWRHQYPWHDDFEQKDEVFPSASYQYVLYGMGFETEPSHIGSSSEAKRMANEQFQSSAERAEKLIAMMPTNRELLNKIHQYGLQPI